MNQCSAKAILILICALCWHTVQGQAPRMTEAAAKEAVQLIVKHSGLLPNFVVREDERIPTAVAYIKDRERIIAYNPAFISTIVDTSGTDLSATSILAHEIAHHLLGHTIDPSELHPGDELACDFYSGFILFQLGATKPEALAAITVAGNVHGTRDHPPKHARSAAVEQGWKEARSMRAGDAATTFELDRMFQFVVRFVGDENTYYVDQDDGLVWFNHYAEPIRFGTCTAASDSEFIYEISWEGKTFLVDGALTIWRNTAHNMPMKVGELEPFAERQ